MQPSWLSSICYAALSLFTFTIVGSAESKELSDILAIEEAIEQEAALLLDKLREHPEVKSVGVLKFGLKHESQNKWPASVGTLNQRLAEMTEVALVWANPAAENAVKRQIVVIPNATEVANNIPGATHLKTAPNDQPDTATRENLFSRTYPVAWEINGAKEVIPDAFIFGTGVIHEGLNMITLELRAFRRGAEGDITREPSPGEDKAQFMALLGEEQVAQMGENYVRLGQTDAVFAKAVNTRKDPAKHHPLMDASLPVTIDIRYNEKVQPFKFIPMADSNEPGAKIAEPDGNVKKIDFIIRKRDPGDKNRYGVLLRVNGESTLYRQRTSDAKSSLWVLESDAKAIRIPGFQMDKETYHPIIIKAGQEALALESFYGNNIGLISLTVFEEAKGDQQFAKDLQADQKLETIRQSTLPKKVYPNRSALGGDLTNSLYAQVNRGVMVPDESKKENASIKVVEFKRPQYPLFSATIRYYTPVRN
jgi:hypothetical protein